MNSNGWLVGILIPNDVWSQVWRGICSHSCSASPPNHQGRCPGSSQWGQCWFKKIVCITPNVSKDIETFDSKWSPASIAAPKSLSSGWAKGQAEASWPKRPHVAQAAFAGTVGARGKCWKWLEYCKCTVVCLLRTLSLPTPWCWLLKLSRSCREDLINQTITTSWRSRLTTCDASVFSAAGASAPVSSAPVAWSEFWTSTWFNSTQLNPSFIHSFFPSFIIIAFIVVVVVIAVVVVVIVVVVGAFIGAIVKSTCQMFTTKWSKKGQSWGSKTYHWYPRNARRSSKPRHWLNEPVRLRLFQAQDPSALSASLCQPVQNKKKTTTSSKDAEESWKICFEPWTGYVEKALQ